MTGDPVYHFFDILNFMRFLSDQTDAGLSAFIMEWLFETDLSEKEAMEILYDVHSGPVKMSADYAKNL